MHLILFLVKNKTSGPDNNQVQVEVYERIQQGNVKEKSSF